MRRNAPGLREQRTPSGSNPFVTISPYLRRNQLRSAISWLPAAKTATECQLSVQVLHSNKVRTLHSKNVYTGFSGSGPQLVEQSNGDGEQLLRLTYSVGV